jgi:hypothetical protein
MHCFACHEKHIARYGPAYFWRPHLIAEFSRDLPPRKPTLRGRPFSAWGLASVSLQ